MECFYRIAGFANGLFKAWNPAVHAFYTLTLDTLTYEYDPALRRNFEWRFSAFAAATLNFGPMTVTLPHIDGLNLAWGWCAITALGSFNPDLGGHLVLWDLKLIIRFPPGSTILIPSAILRHSNVVIQPGEQRYSFTQFTAAGLFRWVDNGFKSDLTVNDEIRNDTSKLTAKLSPAALASHRLSSQKYRWNNEQELREKARVRMAVRRQAMKAGGLVSPEDAARTRAHHAAYREKKGPLLAFKQRRRRQDAFIAKYGDQAYTEHLRKEAAAQDEAEWRKRVEADNLRQMAAEARRQALHHAADLQR
ncbi:hypothetical protein B0H15DRAFT_954372 [Mycena belliarum]|uniref:Uncharacterized protein n=1 Tax=Mycena belliarum TaxID=1033014 RepID=A0AAD6TYD8_9AGAR|nr:hypothetical protein B0H15DRAFT_954372 [Mycena belliae]